MANVTSNQSAIELEQMHAVYRQGGADRETAPHVVYQDGGCPHPNCAQRLQAIDVRLKAFGRAIHDPLVGAWWNDIGFAGRCPTCQDWTTLQFAANVPSKRQMLRHCLNCLRTGPMRP